jgi:hypothetical protein
MFSNAFSALKNAASAILVEVAPPPNTSALDDLKHYWDLVKQEHQHLVQTASKEGLDAEVETLKESTIRENLENIVTILRNENDGIDTYLTSKKKQQMEEQMEKNRSHYPCIQYVIEERVLEILCAMALADHPPGMMALVLQTTRLLLFHITEQQLLFHVSIHKPLCHMIHVCMEARKGLGARSNRSGGGTSAGVSVRAQASLVALLEEIWKQVEKNPELIHVFFNYGREGLSEEQQVAFDKRRHHHLLIFAALIPYMHVKRQSGDRARNALMTAVGIRDAKLHEYMLHRSVFCRRVADGLSSSYAALPSSLDSHSDDQDRAALTALEEFKRRLAFARDLCLKCDEESLNNNNNNNNINGNNNGNKNGSNSNNIIGNGLAESIIREIRERFFEDRLMPSLMSVSENGQTAATVYTHTMLQTLCQTTRPRNPLLSAFLHFMLGNENEPERDPTLPSPSPKKKIGEEQKQMQEKQKGSNTSSSISNIDIRTVLIHRISSQAQSVSEVTMELFNCFFEVGGSYVLHNLVIRNMVNFKLNHDSNGNNDNNNIISEGVDKDGINSSMTSSSLLNSKNPTKSFLDVFADPPLPLNTKDEDLISFDDNSDENDGNLVFPEYLTDAHKQYVSRMAQYWSISDHSTVIDSFSNSLSPSRSSSKSGDGITGIITPSTLKITVEDGNNSNNTTPKKENTMFYEGLFLNTLLDKLESMLDHSLDENLVLTGLWSQLAQCPHPRVYHYLFSINKNSDKTIDDEGGNGSNRSFLGVLESLWSEAQQTLRQIPDGENILINTRKRLGINVDENRSNRGMDEDGYIIQDYNDEVNDDDDITNMSNKTIFEGICVLEEFLKEIAGILKAREELNMLT